jgi:hypothetical protein
MRDNGSLAPIVVLEGSLRIGTQKKEVSIEGMLKELLREKKEVRGEIAKLDKRIAALEPKKKQEAKAESSTAAEKGDPLTKKQKKAAKRAAKAAEKAKRKGEAGGSGATNSGGGGTK